MKLSALLGALVCGVIATSFMSTTYAQTTAPAKKVIKKSESVQTLKPQTTCPVQGDPINKKLFVDYKGKRIYVCCEGCIAQVQKDPELYIKKLADMGQKPISVPSSKTSKAAKKSKAMKADTSMKGMDMSGK